MGRWSCRCDLDRAQNRNGDWFCARSFPHAGYNHLMIQPGKQKLSPVATYQVTCTPMCKVKVDSFTESLENYNPYCLVAAK